jgi:2',3'-cyclic-nucleotide 2'-phosphodiesterase (5'-nucleotidase family)
MLSISSRWIEWTRWILAGLVISLCTGCGDDGGASGSDTLAFTILQTSDVHHHATGYGPQSDYTPLDTSDRDGVLGGYARIAALVQGIRSDAAARGESVLLFDSGDFTMGTTYDLTASAPAAFRFLDALGYDAVTLGNHEFDWALQGLGDLIAAARQSGFEVPIVASNLITDPQDAGDDDIEALIADNVVVASKLIEISSEVQVGVLGVLGPDADSVAPLNEPVTFNQEYAFLQSKVDELKAAGADIVILLSHSGVLDDGTGEDVEIAENVTGIDIIASGHTHTATTAALINGASNTIIFSPGGYGAYVSKLDIRFSQAQHRIIGHEFELLRVDDTVAGDQSMHNLVLSYQPVIDEALAALGVSADTVISKIGFDLEKQPIQETGFGDLVADAIRMAATDLDTAADPYDLSVIASGVIRDNLYQGLSGRILFSDVYNALPLGFSPYGDAAPGYPLMSVYVTAAEIRNICEISASGAPLLGDDYYLNVSGIRYDYNPANALFARVTAVYLSPDMNSTTAGAPLDLADEATLYHVAVNRYLLEMMDLTTSFGIPVIAKDSSGNPLTPSNYPRIDVSADAGVQELKEWMALSYYLESFYPATGAGVPAAVYGDHGTALGRANDVTAE